MFVPVNCTSCGKPFQVPESVLGQLTPCPWCQAVVTALPVSAPVGNAEAQGQTSPQAPDAPEPLSLDEDTSPAPGQKPAPQPKPAAPRTLFVVAVVVLSFLALVVAMAGTLIYRGYGRGQLSDAGWVEFTPEDGSFNVMLPDNPVAEELEADPGNSLGPGKRFVARGWYSKTAVWVGYRDLDPALARKLPADKDRVFAAGVLRAERDRERARLGGTITKEAEVRLNAAWGVELQMDTPEGKVVEWVLLLGEGPRPRVYTLGAQAKDITPESRACRKLFDSFRVNN